MSRPADTRGRWFVSEEEEELERLEDEEREASIGPTDEDLSAQLDDGTDVEQHDRPPDCDRCGGKGCPVCDAPGYAGVEVD